MVARLLSALFVVFMVASCGGAGPEPAAASRPAMLSALRNHASATPARTPLEAANALMDFAERAYPANFPSREATGFFAPFAYRFYPQTGVYLGVVIEDNSSYASNGVYLKGGDFGPEPVPVGLVSNFDATKGIFIGNSITFSPANPAVGWDHSSGMSASSAATDYAHLVGEALHLWSPTFINFAALERDPAANRSRIAELTAGIDAATAVTIQLGDNASPDPARLAEFTAAYHQLLDAAKHGRSLVCVSTWWELWAKDTMIKEACEARGGIYVSIGDIRYDPKNRDPFEGPQYTDPSIQDHPHDWSMASIAQRVIAAHAK